MKKILFFLLCPLFLSAAESWNVGNDDGFFISVELSSSKVEVGEIVTMTILLRHPDGYAFDYGILRDIVDGGGLSVSSIVSEQVLKSHSGELVVEHITYGIEARRQGRVELSFFTIPFVGKGNDTVLLCGDIIDYIILPPREIELTYRDELLMPVQDMPPLRIWESNRDNGISSSDIDALCNYFSIRFRLFLCIGGAAFIFVMYYMYTRFTHRNVDLSSCNPKIEALKALDDLHGQDLLSQKFFDTYYHEVSAILRRYIEKQYRIAASQQTTEEFLHTVRERKDFSEGLKGDIERFLLSADKANFSGSDVSFEGCINAESAARDIMNRL